MKTKRGKPLPKKKYPKNLKWIYEVCYRMRGDVEAEHKITEIMNCQSIEEVKTAFYSTPRFKGMTLASCRRLRRMVPEDLEKLEAPARL